MVNVGKYSIHGSYGYEPLSIMECQGFVDIAWDLLVAHSPSNITRKPPRGKVKVILGTNIAESSVTISDVEVVIDSGLCPGNGERKIAMVKLFYNIMDTGSMVMLYLPT